MPIPGTTPSACIASPPRPGRYRWFVRLCAAAIVLVVLPTALLQATSSALGGFGGVAALICLAVSFAIWQAALVFLCKSGREVLVQHIKATAAVNTLYIVALTAAVSLFFLLPAHS